MFRLLWKTKNQDCWWAIFIHRWSKNSLDNPRFGLKICSSCSLSYNLLSIGKLTKDPHCSVVFTSYCCIFQGLWQGRWLGMLYWKTGYILYLNTSWNTSGVRPQDLVSASSPNADQILIALLSLGFISWNQIWSLINFSYLSQSYAHSIWGQNTQT